MTHAVIVNARQQYALWPSGSELPHGWHTTGWGGAEQTCLGLISELWHDGVLGSGPRAGARCASAPEPGPFLLVSARLWLREVRVDEARALAAGDGAGLGWLGAEPGAAAVRAAEAVCRAADAGWHRPGWGMYLLMRAEDARVLGTAAFSGAPREGTVDIGLDLHPPARGLGYAGEALDELSRWALRQGGVREVGAVVSADRTAARAVLERTGFEQQPATAGRCRYVLSH